MSHLADYAAKKEHTCLVLSKDAKSIVPANIMPVQLPGKTWKRVVYDDHTWDQGRLNTVVPMTFLFLRSEVIVREPPLSAPMIHITRTGKAVTLINLAHYEPGITVRCLNEIFLLIVNPCLDSCFRNLETGKLKDEMIFVVDNGPAEAPSSTLVQMCLVCLLKVLNLSMVIQVSFAEYHSKRNYVERVHAVENDLLSRHGPFKVDTTIKAGTLEYQHHMEKMADKCLSHGRYGGSPLQIFRGVKPADMVFDDKMNLKHFMALSEERKDLCSDTYKPVGNSTTFQQLVQVWDVDKSLTGSYASDYSLLQNKSLTFLDKYTTIITNGPDIPKLKQPLPDYVTWYTSTDHELHYLSYEARYNLPEGPWEGIPGLFLPTVILDLAFKAVGPYPPNDILYLLSLLAWIAVEECREYLVKKNQDLLNELERDIVLEQWVSHPLYLSNTSSHRETYCRAVEKLIALSKPED